jgi:hypothetical protein
MNKRLLLAAIAALATGTASAEIPLFAAKCGAGITTDSNSKGQVYINGKVAKVIMRPDGQISANSAGVWVDITPQGGSAPRITFTAKDKSTGECEVLSFKAPGGGAHGSAPSRGDSSERAGRGDFDAHAPVKCAQGKGAPMVQCNAAVAREGGGTATVVVTRPDGRKRFIFFEKGKAVSADLSQADGSQHFHATKKGDLYLIEAGHERYELIEALVYGG